MSQRYFLTTESTYEALRLAVDGDLGYPTATASSIFTPALQAPRDSLRRIVLAVDTSLPGYGAITSRVSPLLANSSVQELTEAEYLAFLACVPTTTDAIPFTQVTDTITYTNFLPSGGSLDGALSGIDSELSGKMPVQDSYWRGTFLDDGVTAYRTGDVVFMGSANTYWKCPNALDVFTAGQVPADYSWVQVAAQPTFHRVAVSGSYTHLLDKPTLGTAAAADAGDFAALSHAHGELTSDGKVGGTAGLVLKTGTAGAVEALAQGTAGQVLKVNGTATGVEWGAAAADVSIDTTAADILSASSGSITADDPGADRLVFWDDSAGKLTHLEVGTGLAISGTTLSSTASGTKSFAKFTPSDNNPPATNFATLDTRNSVLVLEFDAATDESAVFVGYIPEGATLTNGLKVRLSWMADTATSGNVRWGVQFEADGTDLDSDSFDTAALATSAANGTSGIETVAEITATAIDSLAAGDRFRLRVYRDADDATNDTMTGDAQLVAVEVQVA